MSQLLGAPCRTWLQVNTLPHIRKTAFGKQSSCKTRLTRRRPPAHPATSRGRSSVTSRPGLRKLGTKDLIIMGPLITLQAHSVLTSVPPPLDMPPTILAFTPEHLVTIEAMTRSSSITIIPQSHPKSAKLQALATSIGLPCPPAAASSRSCRVRPADRRPAAPLLHNGRHGSLVA